MRGRVGEREREADGGRGGRERERERGGGGGRQTQTDIVCVAMTPRNHVSVAKVTQVYMSTASNVRIVSQYIFASCSACLLLHITLNHAGLFPPRTVLSSAVLHSITQVMLRLVRKDLKWADHSQKVLVVIGDAFPHAPTDTQNKDKIDWKKETQLLSEMVSCLPRLG